MSSRLKLLAASGFSQTISRKGFIMIATYHEISFSDADVVNIGDFIPADEFNPHKVRPFLLHDHGFVVAVVFASCLQDALDEAADAGKLDRFAVSEAEMKDYSDESLTFLGNAS